MKRSFHPYWGRKSAKLMDTKTPASSTAKSCPSRQDLFYVLQPLIPSWYWLTWVSLSVIVVLFNPFSCPDRNPVGNRRRKLAIRQVQGSKGQEEPNFDERQHGRGRRQEEVMPFGIKRVRGRILNDEDHGQLGHPSR